MILLSSAAMIGVLTFEYGPQKAAAFENLQKQETNTIHSDHMGCNTPLQSTLQFLSCQNDLSGYQEINIICLILVS